MIAHCITTRFLSKFLMICRGVWLHSVNKVLSGLEKVWNVANSAYYVLSLLVFLPQHILTTAWLIKQQHNSQDKYSSHLCVTVQLDQWTQFITLNLPNPNSSFSYSPSRHKLTVPLSNKLFLLSFSHTNQSQYSPPKQFQSYPVDCSGR